MPGNQDLELPQTREYGAIQAIRNVLVKRVEGSQGLGAQREEDGEQVQQGEEEDGDQEYDKTIEQEIHLPKRSNRLVNSRKDGRCFQYHSIINRNPS